MTYQLILVNDDGSEIIIREAEKALFLKSEYFTLRMHGKNAFIKRFENGVGIFVSFNGRKLKKH